MAIAPADGWAGALARIVATALAGQRLGGADAPMAVERPFDGTLSRLGNFLVRPLGAEVRVPDEGSSELVTGAGLVIDETIELALCVSEDRGRVPRVSLLEAARIARKAARAAGWRDVEIASFEPVEWTRETEKKVAMVASCTLSGWTFAGLD